jgi:hypothetical protein
MSTIKLKRIKQAVDTGVTQPLSIGGVASDNSDEVMNIGSDGTFLTKKGIKFPTTQIPSADPNTLDDYRELTFTPTVIGSNTIGTASYSKQTGVYTKIGNLVQFSIVIQWSAFTGLGTLQITGLPFTIQNIVNYYPMATIHPVILVTKANNIVVCYGLPNSNTLILDLTPVGGGTPDSVGCSGNTSGFIFVSGSYRAAV